jgi:hypothetical protein
MPRPYTGNKTGLAGGASQGLLALVDEITKHSDGALWNNGTFVNRPMRGKESLSVHATGRAADISWRKMEGKGCANGRERAEQMLAFLTQESDKLGIEMLIDYFPAPYGAGWRCDRGSWQKYGAATVHGAPNGDWFHAEISPEMATKPEKVRAVFAERWAPESLPVTQESASAPAPEPAPEPAKPASKPKRKFRK